MAKYPIEGTVTVPVGDAARAAAEAAVAAHEAKHHSGDPEPPPGNGDPEEPPPPPPPPVEGTVIENWEYRFVLEEPREHGPYVGRDPWVAGPVRVLDCSVRPAGGRNGMAVNPGWSVNQPWDSRLRNYRASETYPITLQPGQTLVCTGSWNPGEAGAPKVITSGGFTAQRPQLKHCATLTCVAEAPPAGSFRQPYTGHDIGPLLESAIDWARLKKLAPLGSTPTPRTMSRTWLDTYAIAPWQNRYAHPTLSMADYGAQIAETYNRALLVAMVEQDRELAKKLVQIGIDLYGVLLSGAVWRGDGGHMSGRKVPILFAGHMLGHAGMLGIGKTHLWGEDHEKGRIHTFQEDLQTFMDGSTPRWEGRHDYEPGPKQTNEGYDRCCNACVWMGGALAMEKLGLVAAWNHPPFLAYCKWHQKQKWAGVEWQRVKGTWERGVIDREWGAP